MCCAFALPIILAAGLAPTTALAAGGELATGEAGPMTLTAQTLTTVPSEGMSVSPKACYLGTGQKVKITAVAEKTYMGSVSSNFTWKAGYYGRFTVLKGGKALASKKVGLSPSSGDDYMWYEAAYSYKPKAAGTFKIRCSIMDGTTEMDRYEKTFKVKKVTALKSYRPTFSVEIGQVGDGFC